MAGPRVAMRVNGIRTPFPKRLHSTEMECSKCLCSPATGLKALARQRREFDKMCAVPGHASAGRNAGSSILRSRKRMSAVVSQKVPQGKQDPAQLNGARKDFVPLVQSESFCEYFSSSSTSPYIFDGVVHGPPRDLKSAWEHFIATSGRSVWRWEGTVLSYVWLPVGLNLLYALGVEVLWQGGMVPAAKNDGLTALVTLLSLLTAFRLSSSYSRFWEGRSEWAKITGCVSDIVSKACVWIDGTNAPDGQQRAAAAKAELARLLRIQVGTMVFTLQKQSEKARSKRYGLRANSQPATGLEGAPTLLQDATPEELVEILEEKYDPPLLPISWLRRHLYFVEAEGLLGASEFRSVQFLQSLDVQICQMWPRNAAIKLCSTPFPVVYLHMMRLLRQFVMLYMPVALADDLSWDMVAVVGIMALGLYGLDEVSTQLEEPFAVADLDDFLTVNAITGCFSKINKYLDPSKPAPNLKANIANPHR